MILGSVTKLNLIPNSLRPTVRVNETDSGCELQFRIYNGETPYNVPEGITATVRGTKGDGKGYAAEVTTQTGSNLVVVTLTEQMTAVAGIHNIFEIVFADSNGLRVGTANFVLAVEKAALNGDTVISDSDIAYAEQVLNELQGVASVNAQVQQNKADIASETANRQSETSSLRSDLSSEASTRASADALLQNEIDQIIAPSGEAPSAAEVQNARIGADGVTYPTLGDAIRANDSLLKSQIQQYNVYNLIPQKMTALTTNGITFSPDGYGGYSVGGTATANAYFNLWGSANGNMPYGIKAGDTIKIYYNGYDLVSLQLYKYVGVTLASSAFASIEADHSQDGYDVTIPNDATGLLIRLRVPNGTTVSPSVLVKPICMNTKTNAELDVNMKELSNNMNTLADDSEWLHGNLVKFDHYDLIPWRTDAQTVNGVTFTPNGDGTYTVNGTATSNAYYNLLASSVPIPEGLEPGTLHTIDFVGDGVVKVQMYKLVNDSLSAFLSESANGNYVFNVPDDATGILIRLRVDSGVSVNNATISAAIRSSNLPNYSTIKKYVAFGDSITLGAVWNPTPGGASHRVKREWTLPGRIALATGFENAYVNQSVGGAGYITKVDGNNIVDNIKAYNFSNTEMVTIMGGANDKLKAAISLGTYQATAGDGTICGAIKEIIDWFKTNYPKIQLIFIQPTPSGIPTGNDNWSSVGAGGWSMNDFDEQVSQLCHNNHVGYCNWWECTYCNTWNDRNIGYNGSVGPNYTHPIEDFDYCILGDFITGKVSALFHSHT